MLGTQDNVCRPQSGIIPTDHRIEVQTYGPALLFVIFAGIEYFCQDI